MREKDITVVNGAPFESKYFGVGDIKLIRIRDIKKNYIDIDNATFIPESQHNSFPIAKAQVNDVIIGLDGDEFRAAIIRESDIPLSINQRIAIIRGLSEEKAIYYMLAINSYIGYYQLERVRTYAGTVGHISSSNISNLRFPIDDEYIDFVTSYKNSIDKINVNVNNIETLYAQLRTEIYSKLDLQIPKEINSFINL